MKFTRRSFVFASGLGASSIVSSLCARRAKAATTLAVVVGLSTKLDSISRAELRRLFLSETDNVGGTVLVPFNMAGTLPERAIFLKTVLAMSPDQESKYWIDRRIRGQGGGPKSAPSVDSLLKVAARFPRALTYVPAALVKPDVKVLRVDGRLPSDAGYPLVG